MKKLITALVFGMMLTVTSVAGFATVKFVLNKVVDQSVTIGSTVQYTEGLFVELSEYDPYTLTYLAVDESETTRHYLTYVYTYTVLVDNTNIEVSSISDDIIVTDFIATESTISITFMLNQDKDFTDGDTVNIQFYFEAIENTGLNINLATEQELMDIGFTATEATNIVNSVIVFHNLADVYINIDVGDAITRFEHLVNDGTLVFE